MRRIYRDKGLLLIPLPGNRGLNVGRRFSGHWSIREWPWAVYDFADHVSTESKQAPWAGDYLANWYVHLIVCTDCMTPLSADDVLSYDTHPRCDDCNMDLAIAREGN